MEPARSRKVEIGLIDGSHLHHRRKCREDGGDAIAPFRVEIVAAFQENGMRAELSRGAQGHGRMDAIAASLVTRRRHDSPAIRLSAHNHGLATQLGMFEQLDRNKECIHVHMQNGCCVQPKRGGLALGTEMGKSGHEPRRSLSHRVSSRGNCRREVRVRTWLKLRARFQPNRA